MKCSFKIVDGTLAYQVNETLDFLYLRYQVVSTTPNHCILTFLKISSVSFLHANTNTGPLTQCALATGLPNCGYSSRASTLRFLNPTDPLWCCGNSLARLGGRHVSYSIVGYGLSNGGIEVLPGPQIVLRRSSCWLARGIEFCRMPGQHCYYFINNFLVGNRTLSYFKILMTLHLNYWMPWSLNVKDCGRLFQMQGGRKFVKTCCSHSLGDWVL